MAANELPFQLKIIWIYVILFKMIENSLKRQTIEFLQIHIPMNKRYTIEMHVSIYLLWSNHKGIRYALINMWMTRIITD